MVRFRKSLTWFEAKGKIEQLFKQLNLLSLLEKCNLSFKSDNIFHPYRSAELYLSNGKKLGILVKFIQY
jgi:phenylalanyl-tRNA synthetase beta subunit